MSDPFKEFEREDELGNRLRSNSGRTTSARNSSRSKRIFRGTYVRSAGVQYRPVSRGRRVTVKGKFVRNHGSKARSLLRHLRSLERVGTGSDGGRPDFFSETEAQNLDAKAQAKLWSKDRHTWRFVIAPEDAAK